MITLFKLGHQPHISHAEVTTLLERMGVSFDILKKNNEFLFVQTDMRLDSEALMQHLGSIVFIAAVVGEDADHVALVSDYLQQHQPDGKIHFSLHAPQAKALALNVKRALKEQDRSVRYIEAKNTATIIHNNLVEKGTDLTIIGNQLFVTTAVQPIEAFSQRDYGKPGADSKSGMLPPKLARMMINLSGVQQGTLLDPFCGSGVLLMEAVSLGFKEIIGTDASKKAIEDAKKNLEWLDKTGKQQYKTKKNLFVCDAKAISNKLPKESVDVIVTEPYMGKPLHGRESQVDLERQAKELGSLYSDAFREFQKILKPRGVVIFIIPKFKYKDRWITVDCISYIEKRGFKKQVFPGGEESLVYWREGQHVGREIFMFKRI